MPSIQVLFWRLLGQACLLGDWGRGGWAWAGCGWGWGAVGALGEVNRGGTGEERSQEESPQPAALTPVLHLALPCDPCAPPPPWPSRRRLGAPFLPRPRLSSHYNLLRSLLTQAKGSLPFPLAAVFCWQSKTITACTQPNLPAQRETALENETSLRGAGAAAGAARARAGELRVHAAQCTPSAPRSPKSSRALPALGTGTRTVSRCRLGSSRPSPSLPGWHMHGTLAPGGCTFPGICGACG